MKKLYTLTTLSILIAAATPAMATDGTSQNTKSTYEPSSNGGYEAKDKNEQTDANGTTTTNTADKKVDIDSKGNKTTSVDIKNSTDPKGLFNKSTTETQNKKSEKNGVTEYSHKKTVNGKTVEESEQNKDQNQ